jgi:hypothetical protein
MAFDDETHRPVVAMPVRDDVEAGGTSALRRSVAASAIPASFDAASVAVAR